MAARVERDPRICPPPFVMWPETQSCVEKDLRGDTKWYRCVGTYSADAVVHPYGMVDESMAALALTSTYPTQVTVVGEWRRSWSEAFAMFCQAFAEVVQIRTRQAMDPKNRLQWAKPTECIYCGALLDVGRKKRSSLFCDVCVECEGKP